MNRLVRFFSIALAGIAAVAISAASAQSSTELYTYDALGRVTGVQTGKGEKSSYSFDAAGNRSQATTKKQLETSWAATDLSHGTGAADPAGGWTATIYSGEGHMIYGPYTTTVPVGARTAVWRMLIDDSTQPSLDIVAYLDVRDANTGETLAIRSLTWTSFASSMSYQIFELPFVNDASRAGHSLEFRVWHANKAHLNVERVGYY